MFWLTSGNSLYCFPVTYQLHLSNSWKSSGLSQGKTPKYCDIYVFLNHLNCVKLCYHFNLGSSSCACVTDKVVECCVPNPMFPISLVIFIAQYCLAWWFLEMHICHIVAKLTTFWNPSLRYFIKTACREKKTGHNLHLTHPKNPHCIIVSKDCFQGGAEREKTQANYVPAR